MDIGAFGKGNCKHSTGKGTEKQGTQDKSKDRDKNKESIGCWKCGKFGHHSSKKDQQRRFKGKRTKTRGQRTLTILTQRNTRSSKSVDST